MEKHGQPDEVYKKASKSPPPQKAVMENESSTEREENTCSGQNIETQAMIATRRPPLQNQQIDIEDEISECKVKTLLPFFVYKSETPGMLSSKEAIEDCHIWFWSLRFMLMLSCG